MEPETLIDFESLLNDAAREILRDEDSDRLAAWLARRIGDYLDPEASPGFPPDLHPVLAVHLARAIWNATPLPGNRYRPAPLPAPGRNDPCPCGSGRKYKHCCASAPPFPGIDPETMWMFVLDNLPDDRLARDVAMGHVPTAALVHYALGLLDDDDPGAVVDVLEPLFAEQPVASLKSVDHERALDLICNAYDDVDDERSKLALLDRVIEEGVRSPLRAGAWQRLAAVRMDCGDTDGAWEAFRQAQRDQPDVPPLAHLEITLLCEEKRFAEAAERARHWERRLRRKGFGDGDVIVDWLRDVARDPARAMASLAIRASDNEGALLRERLAAMRDRPLPRYTLSHGPEPAGGEGEVDEAALAEQLRAMGVPEDQIAHALRELREDLAPRGARAGEDVPHDPPGGPGDGQVLVPPEHVLDVERAWHGVRDWDKPFSVSDEPMDAADPWEREAEWCAFLADHPEAFDSLDVLDDLATAVKLHERADDEDFDREMLVPLLERARAIVRLAVDGAERAHLPWMRPGNRVALRALVRLALWQLYLGERTLGLALAEEALALNPNDNHGLRGILVDSHLEAGRDEQALAIAERYPDDMLAETAYGRALALFRLGRGDEADDARQRAVDGLPLVQEYLVRERVREPATGEGYGAMPGAEEQAWVYREDMRDTWAATPGALQWLRKARPRRRSRKR